MIFPETTGNQSRSYGISLITQPTEYGFSTIYESLVIHLWVFSNFNSSVSWYIHKSKKVEIGITKLWSTTVVVGNLQHI